MNPYQSPEPPLEQNVSGASRSAGRALRIVKAQRGMMWLLLLKIGFDFSASLAAELFGPFARVAYFIAFITVTISIAYFAFVLTSELYGVGPAIVATLLSAIPCLGAFAVLVLNGAAMDQLRKLGVKVGFMGASAMQLEQLCTDHLSPQPPP